MSPEDQIKQALGLKKKSTVEEFAEMIGKMFVLAIITAVSGLGLWAFWNWLAWNVLNAPQMSYWIACAAVITFEWFFKLFKKG